MSVTTTSARLTSFTSFRRVLCVVALALAAQVATAPTADAALLQLDFVSTEGALVITSAQPLTGGGLIGVWDDTTGEFVGGTTPFDPITIPAIPPVFPTEGFLTIGASSEGNVTGTIDPATGEAVLTAAMTLSIYIPAIQTTCTTSAFDLAFTTDAPGQPLTPIPFGESSELAMALTGTMTVPAFDLETGCVPLPQIAAMLNGPLGLPAQWAMNLQLEGTPVPPPSSSTTSTTITTTTTTGASPVAIQPRFAG